jgi:6-phosphogluconolactonase (cycloisomerase 2 family)
MSRPWIRGFLLSSVLTFLFATNLYAQNNFVYTNDDVGLSGQNTVSGFAVAGNGVLTRLPDSPFPTGGTGGGGGPFAVNRATTCSAQNLIYVSNAGSNDVGGFSVNPSTGSLALVPGSPFPTGGSSGGAIALACTPNGQFLMAANNGSSDITVFRIGSDGALAPIVGSPFAIDSAPTGIKISPDGTFLAVALVGIDAMAMFSIAADGTLAAVPSSPFSGAGVGALAGVDINCGGKVLFGGASNDQTTIINVFDIDTNGALKPLPDSPFPPPFPPFPALGVGINSNVVLLSPNERLLFVSNQQSQSVTVFAVAANGSLSPVAGSPFVAPGSIFPTGMATDQAGNFLYVADGRSIYGYSVANNGVLTSVGSPVLTDRPGHSLSLTSFPRKTCNQPPDCSTAIATPSTVWPPNHQMVSISLSGVSDPDGDPVTITPTGVFQDELVTPGDATLTPSLTVRSDRDGYGDGRVYTIQFAASDGRGGTCTGAVKVCVPHDQGSDGSNVPCVDEGPQYNSLQ